MKTNDRQLACARIRSTEGQQYLAAMAAAANYAWVNRSSMTFLCRQAFAKVFSASPDDLDMAVVYDVSHNIAKVEEHLVDGRPKTLLVHRKGSTRAFPPHHPLIPVDYQFTGQPVLIGGTMGTADPGWLESQRVPVVLVCETLNNDVLHTRVDNERHEWVEALGVAVPRVVRCTTRKDTVQHFLVQTAGSIPADDLENESRPPDGRRLEDLGVVSHVVFNYAEPDEAARAALASQETTSWTLDESRGSLLGAPARGERGGRTGQRTAGDGPGRSIGALQIAVVAVFIVFVSVVVVFAKYS